MTRYITIPIKESTARKIRRVYDDNIVVYLKTLANLIIIILIAGLFTAIGLIMGVMVVIVLNVPTTPSPNVTMVDIILIVGVAAANVIGFSIINYEGGYIKLRYSPDEEPKKESGFKLKPL